MGILTDIHHKLLKGVSRLIYSEYKSLSNTLDANELENYFREFLIDYAEKPKNLEALKGLYELAYRQWDTYEVLEEALAEKIADYIISAINFDSYEKMDIILSIVENLSLKTVFDYIMSQYDYVKSQSVKNLIDEAYDEYSDKISDPFGVDDF